MERHFSSRAFRLNKLENRRYETDIQHKYQGPWHGPSQDGTATRSFLTERLLRW
jgi:hypothetical protein